MAAAICAIFVTRKFTGRYAKFLTWALVAISVEAVVALTSLLIWWPTEAVDNPEFALARVIGRSIKSSGIWGLALYLMGFFNVGLFRANGHEKVSGEMPLVFWVTELEDAIRRTVKPEFLKKK